MREEELVPPHAFAVPPEQRYFEDYPEGAVFEYGSVTVDAAEIIEFARRFDPQPMHVDPEAAACGPFGGLIASGWHTAGLMMRLFVEHFLPRGAASLGAPAIDELRWPRPVRPGGGRAGAAPPPPRGRAGPAAPRPARPRAGGGVIGWAWDTREAGKG